MCPQVVFVPVVRVVIALLACAYRLLAAFVFGAASASGSAPVPLLIKHLRTANTFLVRCLARPSCPLPCLALALRSLRAIEVSSLLLVLLPQSPWSQLEVFLAALAPLIVELERLVSHGGAITNDASVAGRDGDAVHGEHDRWRCVGCPSISLYLSLSFFTRTLRCGLALSIAQACCR